MDIKISIEAAKHIIAQQKGYPSWDTMEDFIIDHNEPLNVCILIKGALAEAYELYLKTNFNHEIV